MTTWQEHIAGLIAPQSQVAVIFDPDGLVGDPSVIEHLQHAGYSVCQYTQAIPFRIDFEETYRPQIEQNRHYYLLILVPYAQIHQSHLPYVLLHQHDAIEITFNHLFPQLHPQPLRSIPLTRLDMLWPQAHYLSNRLDREQTLSYLMVHLYGIHTQQLRSYEDALAMLCNLHYRRQQLPTDVITVLASQPLIQRHFGSRFVTIIESSSACMKHVYDEWLTAAQRYIPEIVAPAQKTPVDFFHPQLQPLIVALFQNQMLTPVTITSPLNAGLPDWVTAGVVYDHHEFSLRQRANLQHILIEQLPSSDAKYTSWLDYAETYAHYISLAAEHGQDSIEDWQINSDERFFTWLQQKYEYLHSMSPTDPVMVHHITPYLRRYYEKHGNSKIALIVIDGMGLSQWHLIRSHIVNALPQVSINERAVFAWIPTLTNFSRQAIFAGQTPLRFADSLQDTSAEGRLWQRSWNELVPSQHITYTKSLGRGNAHHDIDRMIATPNTTVIGMVIDTLDTMMHGAMLGYQGFQQQVRLWSEQGYVTSVIESLHQRGFDVWITADHGNCLATGTGTVRQGMLVEQRSARAQIYANETLRTALQSGQRTPTRTWPRIQLPDGWYPIVAARFSAFEDQGKQIICHGGASMPEVIVPFIHIRQGKNA